MKRPSLHVQLTAELLKRLKAAKELTGVSVAEYIRRAIAEALKKTGV